MEMIENKRNTSIDFYVIKGGIMNKEYRYRKHFKSLGKIFPIILFICSGLLLILALLILIIKYDPFVIFFFVLAIILFFEGFFTKRIYHRLTLIVVSIDDEGIRYKNYKEEIWVKYEEIIKLKFPSIKYTGGWLLIEAQKKNIRITVVLENIQGLLFSLKQKLDERQMSDKYNNKKFFSFYKTATFSDESWERIYRIIKPLLLTTLGLFVLSIIISILSSALGFRYNFVFLIFMLSLLSPTTIYVISEVILGIKLNKTANFETFYLSRTDNFTVKKVYKKTTLIGGIIYFILLIFIIILSI